MNTKNQQVLHAIKELSNIAQAIGPGEVYEVLLPDPTPGNSSSGEVGEAAVEVEIPLFDVLNCIPSYFHTISINAAYRAPSVTFRFPKLFRRLERGDIDCTIGELVDVIPSYYLQFIPDAVREKRVKLKKNVIIDAIWPQEIIL